ncbi:MAG: N-acyl-D-amino-acid deacylase family protein [Patescibacteria group bacterium]
MSFDLIIRGGTVIDGTGAKAFRGDVGITGDRIAGIGDLAGAEAGAVIEAGGLAVSPGFIDIHSHHDLYLVEEDPLPRFEPFLLQGVTTCVVGNCGWTAAPCLPATKPGLLQLLKSMGFLIDGLPWLTMAEYLDHLGKKGLPCNIAQLVGHGAVRIAVMGEREGIPTEEELGGMRDLVREGMEAGCVGLSTGLMYYPGMYSRTAELIELAKTAAAYGGRYATHLRGYCTTLGESASEAVAIARAAKIPLQISHLHAVPLYGAMFDVVQSLCGVFEAINAVVPLPGLPNPALGKGLRVIDAALGEGLDVGVDIVPYTLGNTTATALFPPWANRGGVPGLLARLRDPEALRRIEHEMRTIVPKWPHWEEGSWSDPYIRALGWRPIRVLSVKSEANRWTEGLNFIQIGKRWGVSPFEALCRLILEEEAALTFTFGMPARPWIEKMFNPIMRHAAVSIGADSVMSDFGQSPPSAYGCFPRVLGHYCRDLGLFSLEAAVHKMTGLSARRYRLEGRGELKPGAGADLVVFDPKTIGERFDADGRPAPAAGVLHVLINGRRVVDNGALTRETAAGRVIRRGGRGLS